jgi:hypothetical protein
LGNVHATRWALAIDPGRRVVAARQVVTGPVPGNTESSALIVT